jgi:hypothetical protein
VELEAFTQFPGATDGLVGAENVETPHRSDQVSLYSKDILIMLIYRKTRN